MNGVAVNVCAQAFVWMYFFPRYMPKSGIAELRGNSVQFLEELPYCFPKQLAQFTFPVNEGSTFTTSCQLLILSVFDYSHPSGNEVVCHCGFDLHFPND